MKGKVTGCIDEKKISAYLDGESPDSGRRTAGLWTANRRTLGGELPDDEGARIKRRGAN